MCRRLPELRLVWRDARLVSCFASRLLTSRLKRFSEKATVFASRLDMSIRPSDTLRCAADTVDRNFIQALVRCSPTVSLNCRIYEYCDHSEGPRKCLEDGFENGPTQRHSSHRFDRYRHRLGRDHRLQPDGICHRGHKTTVEEHQQRASDGNDFDERKIVGHCSEPSPSRQIRYRTRSVEEAFRSRQRALD